MQYLWLKVTPSPQKSSLLFSKRGGKTSTIVWKFARAVCRSIGLAVLKKKSSYADATSLVSAVRVPHRRRPSWRCWASGSCE